VDDADFIDDIEKCMKILDDNEDLLSDIENNIDDAKEDELTTDLQLHHLYDMAYDVAESARMKNAEKNFMKRQSGD